MKQELGQITDPNQTQSATGIWWSPSHPEIMTPGNFTYNGSIKLKLTAESGDQPVLYGKTNELGPCTLIDCFARPESRGLPAPQVEYESLFALLGIHCPSKVEPIFKNVAFHCLGLSDFLQQKPLERSDSPKGGVSIAYSMPESPEWKILNDTCSVIIGSGCSIECGRISATVTHQPWLQFYFEEPQNLNDVAELSVKTTWLMSILLGYRTVITDCEVTNLTWETGRFLQFRKARNYDPFLSPISRLSSVLPYWPQLLDRWYGQDEIKTTAMLFLQGMVDDDYTENRFLTHAQALETYCRITQSEDQYCDKGFFETLKEKVIAALPDGTPKDFRQSFKSRLSYMNQFSLKKRIIELLNDFEVETIQMFCMNTKEFSKKVVGTRNWLVHQGERDSSQTFTDKELLPATMSLQILNQILIMSYLGCPEADIREWITNSDLMRFYNLVSPPP